MHRHCHRIRYKQTGTQLNLHVLKKQVFEQLGKTPTQMHVESIGRFKLSYSLLTHLPKRSLLTTELVHQPVSSTQMVVMQVPENKFITCKITSMIWVIYFFCKTRK